MTDTLIARLRAARPTQKMCGEPEDVETCVWVNHGNCSAHPSVVFALTDEAAAALERAERVVAAARDLHRRMVPMSKNVALWQTLDFALAAYDTTRADTVRGFSEIPGVDSSIAHEPGRAIKSESRGSNQHLSGRVADEASEE